MTLSLFILLPTVSSPFFLIDQPPRPFTERPIDPASEKADAEYDEGLGF